MTDRQQHALKCWSEFYEAIEDGTKTFEVRYDDRCISTGDLLRLSEWTPSSSYTGRETRRMVTYRLPLSLVPGMAEPSGRGGDTNGEWVVLGLAPVCPRCWGYGQFEGETCRVCSGTGTRSAHLPPLT